MIWIIARKEFTEMVREGRFRWAAAIALSLLVASFLMGWQHYRNVNRQHELAQHAMREQWLKQGEKNPHAAAHFGIYAFKPKLPLSFVDRGIDPFVGVAVWLEAHKQNEFKYKPAQDATAVQRFGDLTAATVLQLLLPLLIILLAFPAFAGEQEQGTFRQLLSLGVKKRQLVIGKAMGITIALMLLLFPATIIGISALMLTSSQVGLKFSAARLAITALSYLCYFAIFITLALIVSARASSSRLALIVLLAFWVFNGLIAPRVVADVAKRVYPTPSAFQFAREVQAELDNGVDGHDSRDKRMAALKASTLKKYGVDKIEDLPVNFDGIVLQEGEDHGYQVFDRHYNRLWDTFQRQNRWQQFAGIAAPMLAIRSLSMSLAGTDFTQHRHFANCAENYRREMVKTMNDYITSHQKPKDGNVKADMELWQQMPEFQYHPPGLVWILREQAVSLLVLSGWLVVVTVLVGLVPINAWIK